MNKTRFLNPKVNIPLSRCLTVYLAIDLYLAIWVVSILLYYRSLYSVASFSSVDLFL